MRGSGNQRDLLGSVRKTLVRPASTHSALPAHTCTVPLLRFTLPSGPDWALFGVRGQPLPAAVLAYAFQGLTATTLAAEVTSACQAAEHRHWMQVRGRTPEPLMSAAERAAYYALRHTTVAVSFWRPRLPTLYLLDTQLPAGVAPDGNVEVVRAAASAPTLFRLLCESGVVEFP